MDEMKLETYIGTKIIKATPSLCQKAVHNSKVGDPGYLVEYEDGYRSWSPAEAFEKAYRPTSGMTIGLAIEAMKKGHKCARKGWNGKKMFVVYMGPLSLPPYNTQGTDRKVNDRTAKWIGEDTPLESLGYFAMFTADKKWQPGWLASQSDLLADDWEIVD